MSLLKTGTRSNLCSDGDDIDLWVHCLPKLLEFTDFINELYPTIEFELVYSQQILNVLDVTMHLVHGFIRTDVYSKPTDSHLYLPPTSAHPEHCKHTIPYSVALRLKRNCSNSSFLEKRNTQYKQYLVSQGYIIATWFLRNLRRFAQT